MRGIALLCLVGFILAASWPEGGTVPLATGTKLVKNQTPKDWHPLENDSGFGPQPTAAKVTSGSNNE